VTLREAVNAQDAALVLVNEALYSAAAETSASTDYLDRVNNWHAQALLFMSIGEGIADGSNPRAGEWCALGVKLAKAAGELAASMKSDTAAARAKAFALGLPGAFAKVFATVAGTGGDVLLALLRAVPWPVWVGLAAVVGLGVFVAVRKVRA
jgi:hypothetical protein